MAKTLKHSIDNAYLVKLYVNMNIFIYSNLTIQMNIHITYILRCVFCYHVLCIHVERWQNFAHKPITHSPYHTRATTDDDDT